MKKKQRRRKTKSTFINQHSILYTILFLSPFFVSTEENSCYIFYYIRYILLLLLLERFRFGFLIYCDSTSSFHLLGIASPRPPRLNLARWTHLYRLPNYFSVLSADNGLKKRGYNIVSDVKTVYQDILSTATRFVRIIEKTTNRYFEKFFKKHFDYVIN